MDDGSAAILSRSVEETCVSLGEDGRAYRRLIEPLLWHWEMLADEFLQPIVHLPRHPWLLVRFGLLAAQSLANLAQRHFHGERARALFAGLAAHSFLPLEAAGSASFGLVLAIMGHAVGWPVPRGGSQKISEALAAHLRELNGFIETGHSVQDIRKLENARAVLLDLTSWSASRVAGRRLPTKYRERLERFPHGPSVFKMDYALNGPIPWKADACRRSGPIHLGGTLVEIAASEREVARGEVPLRPLVLLAQQSVFDQTRAPAGKHTARAYCHVPRGCRADLSAAIETQIERLAPGL